MQGLYKTFYIDQNKGYSDQAFYKAIDDLVGKPLQFDQWATSPNTEAFKTKLIQAFEQAGMALEWSNSSQKHFHGIITEWKNEKLMVKAIDAQSINYQNNLQAGDEIIAVEDLRVKNNFEDLIRLQKENSKVNILISRAGLIQRTSIELQASPKLDCHISIKDQTNATYKAWLNK
jgi:predicted metalloprotease with PDZ domain